MFNVDNTMSNYKYFHGKIYKYSEEYADCMDYVCKRVLGKKNTRKNYNFLTSILNLIYTFFFYNNKLRYTGPESSVLIVDFENRPDHLCKYLELKKIFNEISIEPGFIGLLNVGVRIVSFNDRLKALYRVVQNFKAQLQYKELLSLSLVESIHVFRFFFKYELDKYIKSYLSSNLKIITSISLEARRGFTYELMKNNDIEILVFQHGFLQSLSSIEDKNSTYYLAWTNSEKEKRIKIAKKSGNDIDVNKILVTSSLCKPVVFGRQAQEGGRIVYVSSPAPIKNSSSSEVINFDWLVIEEIVKARSKTGINVYIKTHPSLPKAYYSGVPKDMLYFDDPMRHTNYSDVSAALGINSTLLLELSALCISCTCIGLQEMEFRPTLKCLNVVDITDIEKHLELLSVNPQTLSTERAQTIINSNYGSSDDLIVFKRLVIDILNNVS